MDSLGGEKLNYYIIDFKHNSISHINYFNKLCQYKILFGCYGITFYDFFIKLRFQNIILPLILQNNFFFHFKELYFNIYDFIFCKIWNIIILILEYLFPKMFIWS